MTVDSNEEGRKRGTEERLSSYNKGKVKIGARKSHCFVGEGIAK